MVKNEGRYRGKRGNTKSGYKWLMRWEKQERTTSQKLSRVAGFNIAGITGYQERETRAENYFLTWATHEVPGYLTGKVTGE